MNSEWLPVRKLPKNIQSLSDFFLDSFKSIEYGSLNITFPDGKSIDFVGLKPGAQVSLKVNDLTFFDDILERSDIGLAEAYIKRKWECQEIEKLIEFSISNQKSFIRFFKGNWYKLIYYKLRHKLNANTKKGSKKNIVAHYDLGNDFYSLWLDSSMTYSSALWTGLDPNASLWEAQQNKYKTILQTLGAKPGDRILEIGCGWGGFLEYAGNLGFHVTGVTISEEQYKYASERVQRLGLSEKVKVLKTDYRDLQGVYDHCVSIEMIEAVGQDYWENYFSKIKSLVKSQGRVTLQAIIMNDQDFENYRKSTDFIQQYIFPGGMLLAKSQLIKEIHKIEAGHIKFSDFGKDYARTLRFWENSFKEKESIIDELGFSEEFKRLWTFYLKYCEGAFLSKKIDVTLCTFSVNYIEKSSV
ncbi:MAG: class I SAM-dependent methyltransferase [Bdellovibrionaceae bacterium]|nr:class I SAM-dependent methyltransferase [Pseudobdellovibrionaceae bacterium]